MSYESSHLEELSSLYPGYAIRLLQFLSGRDPKWCGLVPSDWNGKTKWFCYKGQEWVFDGQCVEVMF